jgi:YD repeat-containing protein
MIFSNAEGLGNKAKHSGLPLGPLGGTPPTNQRAEAPLLPACPRAATTRTVYDAAYRPTSNTRPLSPVTRQTHDLRDRLLTQTDALHRASTSAYGKLPLSDLG